MRNLELEGKIMQEEIFGISEKILREKTHKNFLNPDLAPYFYHEIYTKDFLNSNVFQAIRDLIIFTCLNTLREKNNLEYLETEK